MRANMMIAIILVFIVHVVVDMYKKGGKVGLYENIHAKQKRIANGSKEKMRKPGSKGAPTKQAFINSAKTAK